MEDFWLGWYIYNFFFFCLFCLSKIFFFFNYNPLHNFFSSASCIFACAYTWRVWASWRWSSLIRLVGKSRESDSKVLALMPALSSLRNSLQLSACSGAVFPYSSRLIWAVDYLAIQTTWPAMQEMLVRYRTSMLRILSSYLIWRSCTETAQGKVVKLFWSVFWINEIANATAFLKYTHNEWEGSHLSSQRTSCFGPYLRSHSPS